MSKINKKKQSSSRNCHTNGRMKSTVVACSSKQCVEQHGCQIKKEVEEIMNFTQNNEIINISSPSSSGSQKTVIRQVQVEEVRRIMIENKGEQSNHNHIYQKSNNKQHEQTPSVSPPVESLTGSNKHRDTEEERKSSDEDNSRSSYQTRYTSSNRRYRRGDSNRYKSDRKAKKFHRDKRRYDRRCCAESRKYYDSQKRSRSSQYRHSSYKHSSFKYRNHDSHKWRIRNSIDEKRRYSRKHYYRRECYYCRRYYVHRDSDYSCYKCYRIARGSTSPRYSRDFDEYRFQKYIDRCMRSKWDRW